MTPILIPDGVFPADKVIREFDKASTKMEKKVAEFVKAKIKKSSLK